MDQMTQGARKGDGILETLVSVKHWKPLLAASLVFLVMFMVFTSSKGDPIVEAIGREPDWQVSLPHGVDFNLKLTYRKAAGETGLYASVVSAVENSHYVHRQVCEKLTGSAISEVMAKALGSDQWGEMKVTYMQGRDGDFSCIILDRSEDVCVVVRY